MSGPVIFDEEAISAVSEAVFVKPDAWVVEAYSEFDQKPRRFRSASDLSKYIRSKLIQPKGLAFVFVTYPDMGGRAARQTIKLKPGSVPGHKRRYTWQGWGLISIQLQCGDNSDAISRVTANSEKRALKWQSTYPELDPPDLTPKLVPRIH